MAKGVCAGATAPYGFVCPAVQAPVKALPPTSAPPGEREARTDPALDMRGAVQRLRSALKDCERQSFPQLDDDPSAPSGKIELTHVLRTLDCVEMDLPNFLARKALKRDIVSTLNELTTIAQRLSALIGELAKASEQNCAENYCAGMLRAADRELAEIRDEKHGLLSKISVRIPDDSRLLFVRDLGQFVLACLSIATLLLTAVFAPGLPLYLKLAASSAPVIGGLVWGRIYDRLTTPAPVWKSIRELVNEIRNTTERTTMLTSNWIYNLSNRYENAVQSMQHRIDSIEQSLGIVEKSLEERIGNVDKSLEDVEKSLEDVEKSLEQRLNSVDKSLEDVEQKLNDVDRSLEDVEKSLEQRLSSVDRSLEDVEKSLEQRLSSVDRSLEDVEKSLEQRLSSVDRSLEDVEKSLEHGLDNVDKHLNHRLQTVELRLEHGLGNVDKNLDHRLHGVVELSGQTTTLALQLSALTSLMQSQTAAINTLTSALNAVVWQLQGNQQQPGAQQIAANHPPANPPAANDPTMERFNAAAYK